METRAEAMETILRADTGDESKGHPRGECASALCGGNGQGQQLHRFVPQAAEEFGQRPEQFLQKPE